MNKLLDTTHHCFDKAKVESIAASMRDSDPDWEYRVKHDPKGGRWSLIEVYDEDGEFVARV